MSQLTFAEAEYEGKKRKTRRETFLERMDALIPWEKLERQLAKGTSEQWQCAQAAPRVAAPRMGRPLALDASEPALRGFQANPHSGCHFSTGNQPAFKAAP